MPRHTRSAFSLFSCFEKLGFVYVGPKKRFGVLCKVEAVHVRRTYIRCAQYHGVKWTEKRKNLKKKTNAQNEAKKHAENLSLSLPFYSTLFAKTKTYFSWAERPASNCSLVFYVLLFATMYRAAKRHAQLGFNVLCNNGFECYSGN